MVNFVLGLKNFVLKYSFIGMSEVIKPISFAFLLFVKQGLGWYLSYKTFERIESNDVLGPEL